MEVLRRLLPSTSIDRFALAREGPKITQATNLDKIFSGTAHQPSQKEAHARELALARSALALLEGESGQISSVRM